MYRFREIAGSLGLGLMVWLSLQFVPSNARAQSCPPVHTWDGESAGSIYGSAIAEIGDLNDDGFDEMAIGASDYLGGGPGRLYVYSGQDQSLLFTIVGEEAGDNFGLFVAGADLDHDGYADLLVNATTYSGVAVRGGRVYVFYGGPGAWSDSLHASAADVTLDGDSSFYAAFGTAITIIDDVDGDSCPEVAMGASYQNYDGVRISPGRVFVYSGRTLDTMYTLHGNYFADWFGLGIDAAGDVNGDSLPDILVGACYDWNYGIRKPGYVYVYSVTDGQLITKLKGANLFDAFGYGVAGLGDINGDGYDDLAVGAHHDYTSVLNDHTGRAYVYLGGPALPDTLFTSDAVYDYTGEHIGANFGGHIEGLGDVNQDGHDDFAISAYAFCAVGSPKGSLHLYSGADGSELFRLSDDVTCGQFGYWTARTWDLDSDGVKDLWVGAPGVSASEGRAYCYLIGDTDQDSLMAGCDNCPTDFNPAQDDVDSDGYGDVCDNCPSVCNADQGVAIDMTGDVNVSGKLTSADVIYLVNFTFKSGPAPLPLDASGDVDCSGSVTSADVIYMVNHVFKSGPPPCDVCTELEMESTWACP